PVALSVSVFACYAAPLYLLSFPTRRSSDLKRMEKGEVLLLDVRPKEEFEKAHIPGAISAPMEDLREKLSTLPTNCDVVAYCRGPDRKSTRLNSSHVSISYAVFCLKKKNKQI